MVPNAEMFSLYTDNLQQPIHFVRNIKKTYEAAGKKVPGVDAPGKKGGKWKD